MKFTRNSATPSNGSSASMLSVMILVGEEVVRFLSSNIILKLAIEYYMHLWKFNRARAVVTFYMIRLVWTRVGSVLGVAYTEFRYRLGFGMGQSMVRARLWYGPDYGMDQSWVCTWLRVMTEFQYRPGLGVDWTLVWTGLWYGPGIGMNRNLVCTRVWLPAETHCGTDQISAIRGTVKLRFVKWRMLFNPLNFPGHSPSISFHFTTSRATDSYSPSSITT